MFTLLFILQGLGSANYELRRWFRATRGCHRVANGIDDDAWHLFGQCRATKSLVGCWTGQKSSKIYMIDSWMIMAKESWSHRHNSNQSYWTCNFCTTKVGIFFCHQLAIDGPDAIGQCQGIWWDLVWPPLVQSQLRRWLNTKQKSFEIRRERNKWNKLLQVAMASKVVSIHLVQQCGIGTSCSFTRTCEKALAAAQGASVKRKTTKWC